ncbi:MAG: 16S rRNA (guanine(966)-N(2))-methyltransferase RsmD [candidate division WOR-3 bacterium]
MKILTGIYKGRNIKTAPTGIRPTKAIVRAAVFNILGDLVIDASVLDIFAGTGAMGIEALSRGARFCVFIEKDPHVLFKNIKMLKLQKQVRVIKQDFRPGLKKIKDMNFDIVFIDPPYQRRYLTEVLKILLFLNLITKGSVVVAEYSGFNLPSIPEEYSIIKTKRYGETMVSFLKLKESE